MHASTLEIRTTICRKQQWIKRRSKTTNCNWGPHASTMLPTANCQRTISVTTLTPASLDEKKSHIIIVILGHYIILNVFVSLSAVGATPRITVPPPTSLEVSKGQTVRLNCLATGIPPPLIYWYYAGLEWSEHVKNSIKNDSKYTIYVNGTLILRDLQAEDIGFYECGARNVIGTTSRKTKIFVPSKL